MGHTEAGEYVTLTHEGEKASQRKWGVKDLKDEELAKRKRKERGKVEDYSRQNKERQSEIREWYLSRVQEGRMAEEEEKACGGQMW